jgi:hypothetical protein
MGGASWAKVAIDFDSIVAIRETKKGAKVSMQLEIFQTDIPYEKAVLIWENWKPETVEVKPVHIPSSELKPGR